MILKETILLDWFEAFSVQTGSFNFRKSLKLPVTANLS
jgi:hypothetical protein